MTTPLIAKKISLSVLLVLTLCAVLFVGCQANPGRVQKVDKSDLRGGQLVFEELFETPKLSTHWLSNPKAKIVDGWLQLEKNRNEPPLWLDVKLPEKVRVEFDARSLSEKGDIKVEIFGDGLKHQSGYILVFGAHSNQEHWFARLDEHGKDRKLKKVANQVKKGRTYHWSIIRTDQRVRWFIDGEHFMTFDDPKPLLGSQHAYFAFNDWDTPLQFDNLKVFDLSKR